MGAFAVEEKKLTIYILKYLLKHHFKNKVDMARRLDIDQRALQKMFRNINDAKAGTFVLDKVIFYCAKNRISLDMIIMNYVKDNKGAFDMDQISNRSKDKSNEPNLTEHPAYTNLRMKKLENLNATGQEMYESMLQFLQHASAHVCPQCHSWCNPWNGNHDADEKDCYIGGMAREIVDSIAELYTETEVSGDGD